MAEEGVTADLVELVRGFIAAWDRVVDFREGSASRSRAFLDHDEALRAADLPE